MEEKDNNIKDDQKRPNTQQTGGSFNEKIEGDPTKFNVKPSVSENINGLVEFFKSTISFRNGVKKGETIKNIKKDVVFQGHNVWILVCSMIVASIGLNMNSTAVVIGAMLISPLMGPILGVGLGLATVDVKLIYSSLKNFGVMIAISLVASFLYFLISPVKLETSELLGRVKPNAFDIPIAFFGGLAGIIAASRGGGSNVVPGVAIATALMPPLCTMGYGFAIGNLTYALGAFYLFLLNSLFICLATFITLRYLRFPVREFLNKSVEKKAKLYIYIVMGIVVVPAILLSIGAIRESKFQSDIHAYIEKVIKADPNIEIDHKAHYSSETPKLSISVLNDEVLVTDAVIKQWKNQLEKYDLEDVKLIVSRNDINEQIENKLKEARLFDNGSNEGYKIINQKEKEIEELEERLEKLKTEKNQLSATEFKEVKVLDFLKKNYPKLADVNIFSNKSQVLLQANCSSLDSLQKEVLKKEIKAYVSGQEMGQSEVILLENEN